jgi:hypothetical protein
MPEHIEISISRADLPKAHPGFGLREVGLEEEDFDLLKANVWIDDVFVAPRREKDRLVVKIPLTADGPQTIAVTTETGKLIGILEGNKIPLGKETAAGPPSGSHTRAGKGT